MKTVGIVGLGRFGSVLAELLEASGHEVRGYDPAPLRRDLPLAASARALAAQTDVLVLAVPVDALSAALAELEPALEARHLVLDVASVKVGPERLLRERLGERVPWAATHPLFGPAAVAQGARLPVVICPNALHPAAVREATALFTRAGCEVREEDADAHDRALASSQAIVYFVAKAILESPLEADPHLAPPSVVALARAVEAVQSDAGHLYYAIETANPYAAAARRSLLTALEQVDAELARSPSVAAPPSIPDLGARSTELTSVRQMIDETDRALVELLARRTRLARRAGKAKAAAGRPVHDPTREAQLLEERKSWARTEGLDEAAVEALYALILRNSRAVQGDPS